MIPVIKKIYSANIKTFLSFMMVGLVTAGIYFAIFTTLFKFFHLNYRYAVSFAYTISATLYFFLNRSLSFKAENKAVLPQVLKYICLLILNYVITMLIMELLVSDWNFSAFIALIFAVGATTLNSFLLAKLWIFKNNHIQIG